MEEIKDTLAKLMDMIVIGAMIAGFIWSLQWGANRQDQPRVEAYRELETKIMASCDKYGMTDISLTMDQAPASKEGGSEQYVAVYLSCRMDHPTTAQIYDFFDIAPFYMKYEDKYGTHILQGCLKNPLVINGKEFSFMKIEDGSYHVLLCNGTEVLRKITNLGAARQASVPYVGMRAYYIDETDLGRHTSADKSHLLYSYYDFEKDGQLIFRAKCEDGEVVQIWDLRDNYVPPKKPTSSGNRNTSSYSHKPDPSGYLHPEDFYEDYYDDFYDYEEAEEYFNSY